MSKDKLRKQNFVTKLSYSTSGNSTHPALVFLHAFPLNQKQWQLQIEHFSQSYFCVALDLPGFGEAELATNSPFSFEAYVDYVEQVLNSLNVQPATWIGLSMGGYVALRALERFPTLARAVVLCDTKAASDGNEAKLKRWDGIQAVGKNIDAFIEAQAKVLMGTKAQANPKILETFKNLVKANSVDSIQRGLLALATRTDTTESLTKINIPTLIIVGGDDKVTPIADAEVLNKAIRGSQLAVIQGAGHLSNLEAPEEFNEVLGNFLSKLR